MEIRETSKTVEYGWVCYNKNIKKPFENLKKFNPIRIKKYEVGS